MGFGGSTSGCDSQEETEELPQECDQLGVTEREREEWLTSDQCVSSNQVLSEGENSLKWVKGLPLSGDSDDESEQNGAAIRHSDAEKCFSTCLSWLEQQPEATLILLQELHTLRLRTDQSDCC